MLQSKEYTRIKANYDLISRTHFPKSHFHPDGMSTANSEALFPPPQLAAQIAAEYEDQCRTLCYGPFPTWPEIQARFDQLRNML